MTGLDKCRLTWNTFESHTKDLLGDLLLSNCFSDVTLVCEDGRSIESHKFVLSSCSSVLDSILKGLDESHPLVILNGVQHEEMETLLNFMYKGEATFYQDRLNDLLKVAKHLEVKNISENFNIPENEEETSKDDDRLDTSEPNDFDIPDNNPKAQNDAYVIKPEAIKMEAESPKKNHDNFDNSINKTINELVKQGKQHTPKGVRFFCNKCDYQATKQNHLKVHIQSQHEGIRYSCNYCDYQATNQSNLKAHTQSKHEGVRHPCTYCDYQAKNKSHLKVHIQSQHEGMRYQCDQCEYQTTAPELLRIHRKSVHQGIRYNCDQCNYVATTRSHLNKHIKTQHEGVKFSCNLCDSSYKEKKSLKKHMMSVHNMVSEEMDEQMGSHMMAIPM